MSPREQRCTGRPYLLSVGEHHPAQTRRTSPLGAHCPGWPRQPLQRQRPWPSCNQARMGRAAAAPRAWCLLPPSGEAGEHRQMFPPLPPPSLSHTLTTGGPTAGAATHFGSPPAKRRSMSCHCCACGGSRAAARAVPCVSVCAGRMQAVCQKPFVAEVFCCRGGLLQRPLMSDAFLQRPPSSPHPPRHGKGCSPLQGPYPPVAGLVKRKSLGQ